MLTTLFVVFSALSVVSLVLTLFLHLGGHRLLRKPRIQDGPRPPISILKPLKGVDDGLFENLASLARQEYPLYEMILGAIDPNDPALDVARQVQAAFPKTSIHIVAGNQAPGTNPKVALLSILARHARYEYFLISDSNVRAQPDYLKNITAELQGEKVGLVASLLVGTNAQTMGARLENLHLNTFVLASVSAAEVFAKHPAVIGKSMLFHKRALEEIGGWISVQDVLAEDYIMGRRIKEIGFKVVHSPALLQTVNEKRSLREFVQRHLRWSLLRRRLSPTRYLLEGLTHPLGWLHLALAVGLWRELLGVPASLLWFYLVQAGIGLKCLFDGILAARVTGKRLSFRLVSLVTTKDLIMFAVWLFAGFKRSIVWRGNRIRVGQGSVALAPAGPMI